MISITDMCLPAFLYLLSSFVGCFHTVDILICKVQCPSCPCFVSDFQEILVEGPVECKVEVAF